MTHRPRTRPRWSLLRLLWETYDNVHHINTRLECFMSETQDKLDAITARIDTATTDIRQDIADLKAANPEVDFSSLEAKVAALEGLDAENPAPAPEPPA